MLCMSLIEVIGLVERIPDSAWLIIIGKYVMLYLPYIS